MLALIRRLLEQPSLSSVNALSLTKLADTSDEVLIGLKFIGEEAKIRDAFDEFIEKDFLYLVTYYYN